MSFAHVIKEIARGERGARDLATEDARQLAGALLDGGIPELELGAILVALRIKGEALAELLGFYQALCERTHHLTPPEGDVRTVVLASYNGARKQPNLTPLVALLLQRMGVPVLVHGGLDGHGRIASAYIFRELGLLPAATLAQAQAALDRDKLAFVPTAVLSPGLATLLALRNRLGVRNSGHTLAKLLDPFGGVSLRVVGVTHPDYIERLREFFLATGEHALLMRGCEGEPYANPRKRPKIEYFNDGAVEVLFEQEHTPVESVEELVESLEAKATATYIRRVLEGQASVPLPIVNELACCLYGSGFTADFNQAKAIAAVQTRSLAAA